MGGSAKIDVASSVRVALVSTKVGWHGGELQAALLAEGLHAGGHDCLVLARPVAYWPITCPTAESRFERFRVGVANPMDSGKSAAS